VFLVGVSVLTLGWVMGRAFGLQTNLLQLSLEVLFYVSFCERIQQVNPTFSWKLPLKCWWWWQQRLY